MHSSLYFINNAQALVLAHDLRWKIMQMLIKNQPIYAKQLAEDLELSESKIHYHLTQLREAGLIEFEGIRSIKQGRAKLLKPVASRFQLSLLEKPLSMKETFFSKFIFPYFYKQNVFSGYIIVGSSIPHGKYDATSRDGHLAGELCWYLGSNVFTGNTKNVANLVLTDLEYVSLKKSFTNKRNLILIGGHITNEITAQYNENLKEKFNVFFSENKLIADGKSFKAPEDGLIALFRNPEHQKSWILVLAGVGSLGTRATIFSIINECPEVLNNENEFVTILKGEFSKKNQISGVTGLLTKGLK
ncbi:MAG: ArsR/SmtB family transcription factor [Candidatus Hodarchaeales archaeon]|jgi:DNA-binding transcriptional ArsR family regulator